MIKNLIDRIKFPFRKDKELISELYSILGFYPHDVSIYRLALAHKSLHFKQDDEPRSRNGKHDRRRQTPQGRNQDRRTATSQQETLNNERLEYLGDAVLETVVSDIVFRHFPGRNEGFLTSTRSKIVQRESLNRLAALMEIDRLIRTAAGVDKIHSNVGGNAFEALMGAIYLDRGFDTCFWFIQNRVIGRHIILDELAVKEVNFKSKLLEWTQKNRIQIQFQEVQEKDGGIFTTTVVLEGVIAGQGKGHNKKESQQQAAEETLKMLRRRNSFKDKVFRSKEKRTQMEADERFAVPDVEQKPDGFIRSAETSTPAPTLETRKPQKSAPEPEMDDVEAAYAQAYAAEVETDAVEDNFVAHDYQAEAAKIEAELSGAAADADQPEADAEAPKPEAKKRRTRSRKPKAEATAEPSGEVSVKADAPEVKPAEAETKPAAGEAKTSQGEAKTSQGEAKAEGDEPKPEAKKRRTRSRKPKAEAVAEPSGEVSVKADASEAKTAEAEAKTSQAEAKAEGDEPKPEAKKRRTRSRKPKADATAEQPAEAEAKPAEGSEKPAKAEAKPAAGKKNAAKAEAKPAEAEVKAEAAEPQPDAAAEKSAEGEATPEAAPEKKKTRRRGGRGRATTAPSVG